MFDFHLKIKRNKKGKQLMTGELSFFMQAHYENKTLFLKFKKLASSKFNQ